MSSFLNAIQLEQLLYFSCCCCIYCQSVAAALAYINSTNRRNRKIFNGTFILRDVFCHSFIMHYVFREW